MAATEDAHLFIDAGKVNAEMQRYFADCGVQLRPYEDIVSFVSQLAATAAAAAPSEKIWVDGKTVNWGLYRYRYNVTALLIWKV